MKSPATRKLNRIPGLSALIVSALIALGSAVSCGMAWSEPELKLTRPDGPARVNETYPVTVEVTWTGEPAAYAVLPATVDSIDWGTVRVGQAVATVKDGVNVVSQVIGIIPTKSGEFTSPKISIPYLNPEATPPAEKAVARTDPPDSSASPSLGAEPFTMVVRPARYRFWNSGGLGASLLLVAVLAFLIVRRVRGTRQQLVPSAAAPFISMVQTDLHRARQHRLDGHFYDFYRELAQLADRLKQQTRNDETAQFLATLGGTLKARTQEVGYKGIRPTDDQLDGDFRDIERAVARVKEESAL